MMEKSTVIYNVPVPGVHILKSRSDNSSELCIYYRVPSTPVSNQNRTSLSTVNTISSGQVMRIKKCQLQDY